MQIRFILRVNVCLLHHPHLCNIMTCYSIAHFPNSVRLYFFKHFPLVNRVHNIINICLSFYPSLCVCVNGARQACVCCLVGDVYVRTRVHTKCQQKREIGKEKYFRPHLGMVTKPFGAPDHLLS